MAESIQCWSCGTRMTLEELASNDGDCPECDVEIHLAEYLSKALADIAALRAQLPSQVGEAVEVVATVEAYGGKWAGIHWGGCIGSTEDPDRQLMTVAQHNRIMAAATPAESRVVPVELLRLIEQSWRVPNGWPKSVPESVELRICQGLAELRALLEVKP